MDKMPRIKLEKICGETFIEQIMKVHTPYYRAVKSLFGKAGVHGMAHITGGGIAGNLCRIIPDGLSAEISLSSVKPLPIFTFIQQIGDIEEKEMLSTFNCGVGYIIVTGRESVRPVIEQSYSLRCQEYFLTPHSHTVMDKSFTSFPFFLICCLHPISAAAL